MTEFKFKPGPGWTVLREHRGMHHVKYWEIEAKEVPVKRRMETNTAEVRLVAKRLWVDPTGRFAVVKSVYPEGLVRSLTRRDLESTRRVPLIEVVARNATTQAAYALVPVRYLTEEANDWGEVAP